MDHNDKKTHIIVRRGSDKGAKVELDSFPVSIGRDQANRVVLHDDEVSRFHLRIKKRGNLHILEDLNARNGTFLNGERVHNAVIHNRDRLLLGSTEIQFYKSEPSIEFAQQILDFEMVVAEELGFDGPIDLGLEQTVPEKADRLKTVQMLHDVIIDKKFSHQFFETHRDLIHAVNLDSVGQLLIKTAKSILPELNRGAFFTWNSVTRKLLPRTAKHFGKIEQAFLLSKRAFSDVIANHQGIVLKPDTRVTLPGRQRAILPLVYSNQVLGVLHLESEAVTEAMDIKKLETLQILLAQAAPSVETLMLRREIDNWMVGIVDTMIATLEAKDTYTYGHSERVSRYSMVIAEQLKLNRETKRLLLISSLCHDIGKIGIPDAILKKASFLSAEEYEEMKLHPTIGADIVNHLPNSKRFLSGIKYHHERWDGTGYPDGLIGENIPFFARIVAIADGFDAMISGRSYSGFIEQSEAIEKLWEERDLFDEEILKAFVKAHEDGSLTPRTSTQNKKIG